jgi:hypothetical protein
MVKRHVNIYSVLVLLGVLAQVVESNAQVSKLVGRWQTELPNNYGHAYEEFTADGHYSSEAPSLADSHGIYFEESAGIIVMRGNSTVLGFSAPVSVRVAYEVKGNTLKFTQEDGTVTLYFRVGQASDETKDGPATRDSDDQSNRRTIPSETPSAVNQAPDQGNPPRDSTSDGNRFLAQGEALFTATATTEQLNQAFDFFMKAAELGNADAEHRVGVAYATGKGVQKNESEAVRWYQKSVDHGFAEAQCDLGVRYLHGQGVKKDERTGLKLIRKAAAQGYQEAIDILKNRGLTTDGQ